MILLVSGLLLGCATTQPVDGKKRSEAKHQLGNSLLYEKNYQGAVTELREAAELDPENPNIQNSLGLAYQGLRLPERAIPHYQKAIQLKPDSPEFENNLGTAYAAAKQWDMAIQCFQKAADNYLYRTRHVAYDNLGSAYHNKGDYRRAIENFKKAVEYYKDYAPAYINMGISYEALKEWDNAIAAVQESRGNRTGFRSASPSDGGSLPATQSSGGGRGIPPDRHQERSERALRKGGKEPSRNDQKTQVSRIIEH